MKKKYFVVYSFSESYAHIGATSILSLLIHNDDKLIYDIYILGDGLTDKTVENLRLLVSEYGEKCNIIFPNMNDVDKEIINIPNLKMFERDRDFKPSHILYYRLFVSKILPDDADKYIFLGADTFIVRSLKPLFELYVPVIGMVASGTRNEYKKYLGLSSNDVYYNDDIAIVNVKQWKSNHCTELLLNYLKENGDERLPLQTNDLQNIVLKNLISKISPVFNWQSQFYLYKASDFCKVYGLNNNTFYSPDDFDSSRIVICHFCGNTLIRPWYANSRHPMAKVYQEYYLKTDWNNEGMKNYKQKIGYKIQYLLYKYTPRFFNVFLSAIMQRLFIKNQYHV